MPLYWFGLPIWLPEDPSPVNSGKQQKRRDTHRDKLEEVARMEKETGYQTPEDPPQIYDHVSRYESHGSPISNSQPKGA